MVDPRSKLMRGLLEALILDRLERKPSHGYGILKDLEELFGTEPNRNRIYPLLQRMESEGLVARVGSDEEASRARFDYVLTDVGAVRLAEYRAMPKGFKAAVTSLWGGEPAPGSPEESVGDTGAREGDAERQVALRVVDPRFVPVRAPGEAPLPYPCADSRVSIEKNAVTGDVAIRLTGCPMGAYAYCVKCPIFKATMGYRRLVFGD